MDRVELLVPPRTSPITKVRLPGCYNKKSFLSRFCPFSLGHDCALLFVRGGFSLHRRGYALKYLKVTSVTL